MIETGGFLRITFEIGIESQQAWHHSIPLAERNITLTTLPRADLMLRFGLPPRKFEFYRNPKSKMPMKG